MGPKWAQKGAERGLGEVGASRASPGAVICAPFKTGRILDTLCVGKREGKNFRGLSEPGWGII